MHFISIDTETGGLDPMHHDLLEIGMVNQKEDWRRIVLVRDDYILSSYAIQMHQILLKEIEGVKTLNTFAVGAQCFCPNDHTFFLNVDAGAEYMDHETLPAIFQRCLTQLSGVLSGKINVAGKNFSTFDLLFLEQEGLFDDAAEITFHRRILDPAILWAKPGDPELPDMKTCLLRADLEPHVAHSAVADALNVARLINAKFFPREPALSLQSDDSDDTPQQT